MRQRKLFQLLTFASIITAALAVNAAQAASSFAPIPALSFTKPFGGADPLPQTLSVTSVGAGFNFGTAASTGTGGSWLSVTNAGCCTAMPQTVTVVVKSSPTLAVGSYSGQVVLSAQSGSTSLTIPVTLTVAPPTSPYLDNLPGQMSFSLLTSATAITSQQIQIRSGGPGAIPWTLESTTSDGASWLKPSITSGTSPSVVTVGVNVANLPGGGKTPGTYIGQLVFQTTSGGSFTVPVSVVVGDNVFTQINPLSFVKVFGGANPLPQTLTVASTGTAFNFATAAQTSAGGTWLNVPENGCCFKTPNVATATVSASTTLAVGTYTGQIVIGAQNGSMAITVPVTLTVVSAGSAFIDNVGGQMSFSLKTRGTSITSQDIQIRNGGTSPLNWTLLTSTADTAPWLNVSASSGSAPSQITVSVSAANLPNGGLIAGSFVGQLLFQSSSGNVTVPISVVVGDDIITQINPLSFTKVFGGPDPLPQTFSVASLGAKFNVAINAYTATGGAWLSVPGSGCCSALPQTFYAVVKTSPTLAIGTYTSQIVITAQNGSMAVTVPVTLTISSAGSAFPDNLPGQLSFSLKTSSPNSPPAQTIQIRNAGTGTLSWTLATSTSDGGGWLSANLSSGTAPSLITVGVQKQNLPGQGLVPGTFIGNVVLQTAGGSYSIPVSAVVGDNIISQVNALQFVKPFGGANPLPQTLTFASTGTAFNVAVDVFTASGGSWLSVQNTGCCSALPVVFAVAVNPSATLSPGTYTAEIVVSAQNGSMAITIPVSLTISPVTSTFFDNIPGQLSYSFGVAGASPITQDILLRNGGTGTLNWTLDASTSDGGNWLTVSSPSGTAPSKVTVGIAVNNLPGQGLIAGNFLGELVFSSPTGAVTVPVSVVVGDNTFIQVPPLTFTKAFGAANNPLAQTLNVASAGSVFNFAPVASSATGGNWLSVSAAGCCSATPQALSVKVSPIATLAPGTYTGQIVVTSQNGSQAMTVPVYLNITSTGPIIPATNTLTPVWGGTTGFGSNMYVTIYGTNLSAVTQSWDTGFTGSNAPTSLGGVSVKVNNIPAFIQYVSPTQININTPEDSATGPVNIVVTNSAGTSNVGTATRTRISPTFLSDPSFSIGSKFYVIAETPDFTRYIGPPNLLPNVPFSAAKPGDTVVIFATGCGPTNPGTQAGVIATQNSALALSSQVTIGGVAAKVSFAGMLAGTVGLYQFNVIVPNVSAGDQAIELTVDGVPNAQKLVITIGQ